MRTHLALNTTHALSVTLGVRDQVVGKWDFRAEIVKMRGSLPCEDLEGTPQRRHPMPRSPACSMEECGVVRLGPLHTGTP